MFYLYTEVKGAFIIYGLGEGVNQRGGKNFATYSPYSPGGGGGGGGATFFSILFGRGDFFSTHYFCDFFFAKITLHVF